MQQALPVAVPPVAAPREVVFIDTTVPDWQKLAGAARADTEVFLLQPGTDALAQINNALAGHQGLQAIHIVSHGSQADIILGGQHLTQDILQQHAGEWSAIGKALDAQGDILLYGCDIGAGASGNQFVSTLARLTQADVAASTNATGGHADWVLERQSGPIEANIFAPAAQLAGFDNQLTAFNLSGASGWVPIMFGTGRDPSGDSQAGAADTDIIGDATHGSLYTAFSDGGTSSTADDYMYFRLRIDNPTSSTNFGGVAIVGMDANLDGKVDLFSRSMDATTHRRLVCSTPAPDLTCRPIRQPLRHCRPAGWPITVFIHLRPTITQWLPFPPQPIPTTARRQ